jgi:methylthioribose-1-phosphate isomerase
MKVNNNNYRTVWFDNGSVCLIEQNLLPFKFEIFKAASYKDTCHAIRTMMVRGAGAIGATAGYAMAQAFIAGEDPSSAKKEIEATRPTAQNLFYAVDRVYNAAINSKDRSGTALTEAQKIADEDSAACEMIGKIGNDLIKVGYNIETHCNAGWLAFVDHGSALSPVYEANRSGKNIFVYVDETRPRSQGARLTAWELKNEEVPHVIIPDNAGAFLMSKGKIDIMIVGADRIAANGDTANKIGTLEKAICAKHFGIPFYIAAPTSTFDLNCPSGNDIPIEERSGDEVLYQSGITKDGRHEEILVCSPGSQAINPAFDVTPACLITGIITEKGLVKPDRDPIKRLTCN